MAAIYSSIKKQRCLTHEYWRQRGGGGETKNKFVDVTLFLSSNVTVILFYFFFHFHETDVKRNHLVVSVFLIIIELLLNKQIIYDYEILCSIVFSASRERKKKKLICFGKRKDWTWTMKTDLCKNAFIFSTPNSWMLLTPGNQRLWRLMFFWHFGDFLFLFSFSSFLVTYVTLTR